MAVSEADVSDAGATFSVRQYNNNSAYNLNNIGKPKEIGYFSLDKDRKFHADKRNLKYLYPSHKRINFNLRDGYNMFQLKDDSVPEKLDDVLQWIRRNRVVFVNDARELSLPDFICRRGLLITLACTPYETREGWKIAVIRHHGTHYMYEFYTEEKLVRRARETPREKEGTFWGFKFEQYMTSNEPGSLPDTRSPVNNSEAFFSIVEFYLNRHSLVYSGEIDCVDSNRSYVELKTSREIRNGKEFSWFARYKQLKVWAQSFLLNVPTVIYGFRNDAGVVERLETFHSEKIPASCARFWNGGVCLRFIDDFLTFVKESVKEDGIVYLFEWSGNQYSDVTCSRDLSSEYYFIPEGYVEEMYHSVADK